MTTGDLIKRYRKEKWLTQKELAELSKISVNSLSRYETGERNPNISTLEAIAAALDIYVYELTSKDENERLEYENTRIQNRRIQCIGRIFAEPWVYALDERWGLFIDTVEMIYSLNFIGIKKIYDYVLDLSELEKYTKSDEEE